MKFGNTVDFIVKMYSKKKVQLKETTKTQQFLLAK